MLPFYDVSGKDSWSESEVMEWGRNKSLELARRKARHRGSRRHNKAAEDRGGVEEEKGDHGLGGRGRAKARYVQRPISAFFGREERVGEG